MQKFTNKVVGIDEVGRGCWAGPVVAAAVLLTQPIIGLKDSKLVSKAKRELIAKEIMQSSVCGLGWVSPADVDAYGLTAAVASAMKQAVDQITGPYDQIIIDGNFNFLKDYKQTGVTISCLIKADSLVPAVSAASIIAKVARDQYMARQAKLFPGYGFERHVGYGTAAHVQAIKQLGVCKLHRLSYKPIQVLKGNVT